MRWARVAHRINSTKVLEDEKVAHLCLRDLVGGLQAEQNVDLIVEVAHPNVIRDHGLDFLECAHLFCGSPTCFSDAQVEQSIREAAKKRACFVPSGALWGAVDIGKMADRGTLTELSVTMAKHPSHLFLEGELKAALQRYVADQSDTKPHILWKGPVRALCPLAPNNVNTMACAALAAHNLGFDKTVGCLVADKSLEAHVVTIELFGPPVNEDGDRFHLITTRHNPAKTGARTGNATFASFLSSLLAACKMMQGQSIKGIQFC